MNGEALVRKLEYPDSRREHLAHGDYQMFRTDRNPEDENDALRIFGCVTEFEKFADAVNATDKPAV